MVYRNNSKLTGEGLTSGTGCSVWIPNGNTINACQYAYNQPRDCRGGSTYDDSTTNNGPFRFASDSTANKYYDTRFAITIW